MATRSEQVQLYVRRADDFFEGMQLMRDTPMYETSTALLAVHSAIFICDALRTGLGDDELRADDHGSAVVKLRKLLEPYAAADRSGLAQLDDLLKAKTSVAYGRRPIDTKTANLLVLKAERLVRWANRTGNTLDIAGWGR